MHEGQSLAACDRDIAKIALGEPAKLSVDDGAPINSALRGSLRSNYEGSESFPTLSVLRLTGPARRCAHQLIR
jgi:hypothetical protein